MVLVDAWRVWHRVPALALRRLSSQKGGEPNHYGLIVNVQPLTRVLSSYLSLICPYHIIAISR